MPSAVAVFADDLKREIRNWTHGRVRNVAIEFRDRRVVVRGTAPNYHVKQLVLSALAILARLLGSSKRHHGRLAICLVRARDLAGDAAARCECSDDGATPRPKAIDDVVQQAIGDLLVKDPLIAKSLQIELQRFEFDA